MSLFSSLAGKIGSALGVPVGTGGFRGDGFPDPLQDDTVDADALPDTADVSTAARAKDDNGADLPSGDSRETPGDLEDPGPRGAGDTSDKTDEGGDLDGQQKKQMHTTIPTDFSDTPTLPAASTESVPAKGNPKLSDEPAKEKPTHATGAKESTVENCRASPNTLSKRTFLIIKRPAVAKLQKDKSVRNQNEKSAPPPLGANKSSTKGSVVDQSAKARKALGNIDDNTTNNRLPLTDATKDAAKKTDIAKNKDAAKKTDIAKKMDVETVEEDDNIWGDDEYDEIIDDFPLTDEEKIFIAQELAKQKDQTDEEKDFIAQVLAEQDDKKINGTALKSAGFVSLEDRNEMDLGDKNMDMDGLLSIDATEDASAPKKRGGADSSIITVDEKGMDLESRDASIADKGSLSSGGTVTKAAKEASVVYSKTSDVEMKSRSAATKTTIGAHDQDNGAPVKNSSSVAKGADKVGTSSTAAASTENVPAKGNPKLSDEPTKEKPKHITGGGSAGGGATGSVSFGVGADKSPAKKLVTTRNDMMMMDVSTPSKKSSSGSRADNASTMGMGFSAATKTDNVHPEKMDGTAKQSDTLGRAQRRVSFAATLEVGATEVVDHGKKGRTLTPKKDGDPKKSPANKKPRSDHNQKGDSMEVEEEHSSAGAADNTPRANKKNKGVPLTATKKSPVPKRPNNSATPSKATPSKDTRKNLFRALSEAAVAGDNSDNHVSASAAGSTKPPKKPTGSGASIVDSSKSSSGGDVSVVEKAGSSKQSEQPPKTTGSGASGFVASKSSTASSEKDLSDVPKAGSAKHSEQPPKTTGSGASGFVASKSSTASSEKDLSDVPKAGSTKHSEEALTQTEGGVTDNSKSARSATAASAGEFSVAEKASAQSVHDDDGNTKSPTAAFQVDVSGGAKSGSEKQRAKFQGPSKHVVGTGPAASDTAGALKGDVLPAAKARTTKKLHASQKQAGDSSDEEGFIPDAVHTTSIQRKEARNKAKQPTLAPQKTTAPAGIDDNMDVDDEMPLKASTDVTEKKCAESRDHIHVDDEESLQSAKASPKPTKERPASPIVHMDVDKEDMLLSEKTSPDSATKVNTEEHLHMPMEVDDGEDYEDKALSSRGETGDPSASDDLGGSHALKPATATKGSTTSVDNNDETLGKETSGKQPPLAREQTTTSVEVDGSDEDETPGTATPKVTKERPASFGFSMDVDDGEDKEDKALSSRGETGDASGRAPRSSVLDDFITGKGGSGSLASGSKASEAATSTVGITAKGGSGSLVTSGDEEEEAKASFEDDTRQPASRLATWKDLGGPPSKVSEPGGVPGSLATSGALGEEASSEDEAEASKKPPSRSLPSAEASKFASGTATLTIPEGVTVRKQQKNSKASDAATATEASTTGDDEEEEAKASEDEAGKPEAATAKPNSRPEKSKPRKKHKKGNDQKKRDRTREEITHHEDRQRRFGLQNEKERLKEELGKVSLDQDRRKEIITRIAQIDRFLDENEQNLWTDPNRKGQNSVTGIPWPEPLQDYREHGGNHTFMDLHHAAHLTGGKAWRINGDNCLLEAGCNAIGVRSALTVSDMCKAFETEKKCKPKNGEWKQHEHLFVVAMQQKFKIYNAITRSKKRKDKDRFPMLRSFYQLFNEKQGCFLVVVRMKVNSDSGFNNVGHCFMFNAGAGYIADGNEGVLPIKPFKEEHKEKFDCIARTEAEEQLRKTLSGRELQDFEDKLSKELDQKLAKQFGWSKLETVYQVVVKKDAVERGLVHQQIMPKDMGAQTTESGEGKK